MVEFWLRRYRVRVGGAGLLLVSISIGQFVNFPEWVWADLGVVVPLTVGAGIGAGIAMLFWPPRRHTLHVVGSGRGYQEYRG